MKFLPNEHGEVACIKCLRPDLVHRVGRNTLIGTEPQGGLRLYIHEKELMPMKREEFENLHAIRSGQAARGIDADELDS